MSRALGLAALFALIGCTDSSLYSLSGATRHGPDRVDLAGRVCAPLSSGRFFPVRVLFLFEGGANVLGSEKAAFVAAAQDVTSRVSNPAIKYGLGAFQNTATGEVDKGFGDAAALDIGLVNMASFSESGPRSLLAPLDLAEALLSGDMIGSCPGTLARTRYLVVLVFTGPDSQSCADPRAAPAQCVDASNNCSTACVLADETQRIRDLARTYGVGEVQVQPIYVGTLDNSPTGQEVSRELAAISVAGGAASKTVGTQQNFIENAVASLDYTSLQRPMVLNKAGLHAFNRNAVVRNGQVVADSDGDGLSDDEETAIGLTQPDNPDSDGDGLGDGVEIKVGTDPTAQTVVGGCEPFVDTDRDALTDCEERLLGTDACTGDTDGDGLADPVEFLAGTDPLQPEEAKDSDGDGVKNLQEVVEHTDPLSSDLSFHADHAYGYELSDGGFTPDGRACYDFHVSNIQLVHTLPAFDGSRPAGENDVALYFSVFPADDPNAAGISRLTVVPVVFTQDEQRQPPEAVIQLNDADFELKP